MNDLSRTTSTVISDDDKKAIADAVVTALDAEPTSGYGKPPKDLKWVPIVSGTGLAICVAIALAAAAGAVVAVLSYVNVSEAEFCGATPDGCDWAPLAFNERLSVILTTVGIAVLALGLALLLAEGARLVKATPQEAEDRRLVNATATTSAGLGALLDKATSMLTGLTPTRLVAGFGVLLLLAGAYVGKPNTADPVAPETPSDSSTIEPGATEPTDTPTTEPTS